MSERKSFKFLKVYPLKKFRERFKNNNCHTYLKLNKEQVFFECKDNLFFGEKRNLYIKVYLVRNKDEVKNFFNAFNKVFGKHVKETKIKEIEEKE